MTPLLQLREMLQVRRVSSPSIVLKKKKKKKKRLRHRYSLYVFPETIHMDIVIQCISRLEVNKCAFTFTSNETNPKHEHWIFMPPMPEARRAKCIGHASDSGKCIDLHVAFPSKSKCKFTNLIHTRQKNKIIFSCSWKIIKKMALKCH